MRKTHMLTSWMNFGTDFSPLRVLKFRKLNTFQLLTIFLLNVFVAKRSRLKRKRRALNVINLLCFVKL